MLEALFSLELLLAVLLYAVAILLLEWLAVSSRHWFDDSPPNAWLFRYGALPALRAALLTLFVLLAYPALFGGGPLPPLPGLLFTGEGRVSLLVLVSLVLSLLLPLVPVLGDRRALVLPLQGMAIAAMLFDWLCAHLGVTVASYWPDATALLGMLLLAFAAPRVASLLATSIGDWCDRRWRVSDSAALVFDALLLLMQVPVLLVYTLELGGRLG